MTENLAPLGTVSVKHMFGGAMAYIDGVAFALLDGDAVYLKADDTSKGKFEAEGQGPFVYEGQTRPVTMSYWRIPERLYDEPDELVEWARTALHVARAAAGTKARTALKRRGAAPPTPAIKKSVVKKARKKS
jgi:DNA transformation protein and related proteins